MKYKVACPFADLEDNKHKYEAGDVFPRSGLEVSEDRIKELSGLGNKARKILIVPVEEPKPAKKKTAKRKK